MGESQSQSQPQPQPQRSENRRSPPSDSSESSSVVASNSGAVPERVGKEDVMITLSLSPEPPAPPRARSPLTRSHSRSRSLVGIPGMPSMTRAYSSPGLDSRGRYIFVNGRGLPAHPPADGVKRPMPLQMRADDHIETRLGSLNISETISENAELDTTPRSPSSHTSGSPVLMPQTFPRIGRMRSTSPLHFQHPMSSPPPIHTSPLLGGKYNESYPIHSSSSTSSVPSTPTSLRSRSPSISSLETIPDIPDAEAEALEDEDRIAELKAAADAADAASNANRRRGTSDTSSPSSSFGMVRGGSSAYAPRSDKRKRWSVCGAERRQDLDLETIWED
ncbi:hypothetical protein N7533_007349 [Penicillium manginii]|uniref:uncharacterized protein n=1 Tax=Penicillium manginii TaxID=203109 RepID=UPI002548552E|nr:uncharacterized protein N7533_007349 [Penicillium manginii]KAJ5750321.1 hypothetical protein N7533_007349 [Penicillium manginii]